MSDYFPEKIIHKILLKLPVKPLIKSTLVCKSWMSLIKSSAFIQSHLRTTIASNYQNDSHLLLLTARSWDLDYHCHQHHRLHWDSPEFGEHSLLPNPFIFLENVSDLDVVGTCNGLVLIRRDVSHEFIPVLIWNPSIRKVVMLPKPPGSSTYVRSKHGFGYDDHSHDYKILRIVADLFKSSVSSVQVYSLARGSWKSLSNSVIPVDFKLGNEFPVFVNGTFHMLVTRRNERYICTFNLATEEFGEMMVSEALQLDHGCSISTYGDSLAMIKERYDEFRDLGCDIWVMRQYGVAGSWTKLFHMSVAGGSILGIKRCGEVVLEEQTIEGIEADGDPAFKYKLMSVDSNNNKCLVLRTGCQHHYLMEPFVESLVLLDHCNAISDQLARTE